MLDIIKNNETSSRVFSNYSILRDNEFIGSAILTLDSNIVEVFKKHDKNISNKEYEIIINKIKH